MIAGGVTPASASIVGARSIVSTRSLAVEPALILVRDG